VQGPTKDKRVGCQKGLPRLPEMQGQRATTSVWPSVDLRGAGRLTWSEHRYARGACAPRAYCQKFWAPGPGSTRPSCVRVRVPRVLGSDDASPATGRRVRSHQCDVATVENGVVTSHRFYFDVQDWLTQLGLAPESPA
jgi:hypothetical protein